MVRCLLSFLFIFLMLSSFSFARIEDAALKKEYGPYLTKAPFFLRFDFQRKYNKPWDKSYYFERKAFLAKYEADLVVEEEKEKEEAKAAAEKAKEKAFEKREELQKERDRLKAEQARDKEEEQEYADRQKQMQDAVKAQQQDLQQMEQSLRQN